MKNNFLAVASDNGGFLLANDESKWRIERSFLAGESVNNFTMNSEGVLFAATLTDGVFLSKDEAKTWTNASRGLHVRRVWTVEASPHQRDKLLAGTQYGHLFSSEDSGKSWEEATQLYNAPLRDKWGIDWGFGTTGLAIHTIRFDPYHKDRIFIISSGAGPYRSDDLGETWKLLRKGVVESCPLNRSESRPGKPNTAKEDHLSKVHACSHKLGISLNNKDTLFQQNHCGVYMSTNSGDKWKDISPSTKARHGFPLLLTDHDVLYTIPAYQGNCTKHNSCIQGQIVVYRTRDKGKHWEALEKGLPKDTHTCILRDAMTKDKGNGVYLGTTTGDIYYTSNEGDKWERIASKLGRVQGLFAFGY